MSELVPQCGELAGRRGWQTPRPLGTAPIQVLLAPHSPKMHSVLSALVASLGSTQALRTLISICWQLGSANAAPQLSKYLRQGAASGRVRLASHRNRKRSVHFPSSSVAPTMKPVPPRQRSIPWQAVAANFQHSESRSLFVGCPTSVECTLDHGPQVGSSALFVEQFAVAMTARKDPSPSFAHTAPGNLIE